MLPANDDVFDELDAVVAQPGRDGRSRCVALPVGLLVDNEDGSRAAVCAQVRDHELGSGSAVLRQGRQVEALEARIAAHDDPLRERVRVAAMRLGALRPVQGSRGKAMADWGAFLDVGDEAWFAGRTPSAAAVARMCHSLRDLHLRDLITAWLCPGTLELDAFSADLVDLAHAHLPADRAWPNALSPQGLSLIHI